MFEIGFNKTLQIQAILFNNTPDKIMLSLDSIENALRIEKERSNLLGSVVVCYGDSSDNPIFYDGDIESLNIKYKASFYIKYTYFGVNAGFGKGQNLLGAECNMDYMLIMNPDIVLSPDFFEFMFEPFAQTDIGLVEARQTPIEHPKEYDIETGETSWATGACIIVPTDLFKVVNGFDANSFFMYCEDVDFSWRIRLEGKKIIYQPLACAFHAKNLSSNGFWQPTEAERYYTEESRLMMAYKWSNDLWLDELLGMYLASDDPNKKKALGTFHQKKAEGALPEQIDSDHAIATFMNGEYTAHKYIL